MILFENVYKEYANGVMALYNLNLEIPAGDFVYLMGASGAGKSTLLKLLIREEKHCRMDCIIPANCVYRKKKR